MTGSEPGRDRKTYVVDTSVLVSAPDALQNLTINNTVVLPFPVLQELDRRRTATNGVGYTARSTVRFLDDTQHRASVDEMRTGPTPTTRSSCSPTTISVNTPRSR
jgi:predicted ribonuclease YlaK